MKIKLILLFCLLFPGFLFGANGCNLATSNGISCLQGASLLINANNGSLAFPISNTASDLSLVITYVTAGNTSTVTDTRNTYTAIISNQVTNGTSNAVSVYYAKNIGAGAGTVSATVTGSAFRIEIYEFSGLSTTAPVDQSTFAAATSTSINSGNITTTNAIDLLVGVAAIGGSAQNVPAAGSGYTAEQNLDNGTTARLLSETRIIASTQTIAATWAAITSAVWGSGIVSLKAAPASAVRHRAQVINR